MARTVEIITKRGTLVWPVSKVALLKEEHVFTSSGSGEHGASNILLHFTYKLLFVLNLIVKYIRILKTQPSLKNSKMPQSSMFTKGRLTNDHATIMEEYLDSLR